MEIYTHATDAVSFIEVPADVIATNPNVEILALENGVPVYNFPAPTIVAEGPGQRSGYQVNIPWYLTSTGRDLIIDWTVEWVEFGVPRLYRDRQFVQIITPILDLKEISRVSGWTEDQDLRDLERRVRYAIQSYTGQNFGAFRANMDLIGNGDSRLPLPAPLLGVYSANFRIENISIRNDGWVLQAPTSAGLAVGPRSLSDNDTAYYTGAPIVINPRDAKFRHGEPYSIFGLWGYHDVPNDVRQAARLLAVDYACDESLWRDRYIDSVRAGNWRFEVSERTFDGTGNVLADQILHPYRQRLMVLL